MNTERIHLPNVVSAAALTTLSKEPPRGLEPSLLVARSKLRVLLRLQRRGLLPKCHYPRPKRSKRKTKQLPQAEVCVENDSVLLRSGAQLWPGRLEHREKAVLRDGPQVWRLRRADPGQLRRVHATSGEHKPRALHQSLPARRPDHMHGHVCNVRVGAAKHSAKEGHVAKAVSGPRSSPLLNSECSRRGQLSGSGRMHCQDCTGAEVHGKWVRMRDARSTRA